MEILYDKSVDAIDIVFKKGKVDKTIEIEREVLLDVDRDGTPLSLEIIGASRRYRQFKINKENFRWPKLSTAPPFQGRKGGT